VDGLAVKFLLFLVCGDLFTTRFFDYTFPMLFGKKNETNPDNFWKEYEEKIQEKVLAKSLGRCLSGWEEYPDPLWGLVIATSGGFRFHHFPHEGWLLALTRLTSGGEPPKEKTLFIPNEKITSVELLIERRWWKKLLTPSPPLILVHFTDRNGVDAVLTAESDTKAKDVFSALEASLQEHRAGGSPSGQVPQIPLV
jgi:hypothetical protein